MNVPSSTIRLLGALALCAGTAAAAERPRLHADLEREALRAIALGLRWLERRQHEDGHWSLGEYPAITALAAQAFLNDPARRPMELKPHVRRALDHIVSCAREDGGIYRDIPRPHGGGLRNYNTAICVTALAASGDVAYDPVVRRARAFLKRMQQNATGVYRGGFGYDAELDRPYADMTNTITALEAFKFTRFVEDNSCAPPWKSIRDRPAPPGEVVPNDPDWDAALRFLAQCQNLRTPGVARAVSSRAEDAGGFFYEPNRGMAGGGRDADGRPIWYSYGTATYGGLMCLLYADLPREDPRIQGAIGWIRRHWTVEEHPGLGRQGLYFYYLTVAKALRAYGEEPLRLADGTLCDWRAELTRKLISLQRKEARSGLGYWVNDEGRWMENDPVLVTAYAVLTLEMLAADTAP